MIVLIGSNGSMGRRYQAILKWIDVQFVGFDVGDGSPWEVASSSNGIIIATPTWTHGDIIAQRRHVQRVPILCEKPLSTNLSVVDQILEIDNPLQMMNQYRLLDTALDGESTSYNYYHSGSDGLVWDCITLLGLARGPIGLYTNSPVWRCRLNGRTLTRENVEQAYIDAVLEWLRKPEGDRAWIRQAHKTAKIHDTTASNWTIK